MRKHSRGTSALAALLAASFFQSVIEDAQAADVQKLQRDPARVMGVVRGDCKKCHPSEVASWMKTVHYQSADLRLYSYTGNTKKYAEALGITRDELAGDSLCADCHGTKAVVAGRTQVISGVSCESCHGAAGGENGWLNRHQSYHSSIQVPRRQETAEHRQARIEACESAGMLRSDNVYSLVRTCFRCHLVQNEKLIAAGHKTGSAAFEFVSWSDGEVRHNFLLNRDRNEDAPSLWKESHGSSAENRNRLKYVAGTLAQLEMAFRSRAGMANAAVIPQVGGSIAAINGKLGQINAMSPSEELMAIVGEPAKGNLGLVTPLLGTLFVAQPNDAETYSKAADKVAEQAQAFTKNNDGSQLPAIDALINAQPRHFSQQFRQRFLRE